MPFLKMQLPFRTNLEYLWAVWAYGVNGMAVDPLKASQRKPPFLFSEVQIIRMQPVLFLKKEKTAVFLHCRFLIGIIPIYKKSRNKHNNKKQEL